MLEERQEKYILIENEADGSEFKVDSRILPFSGFLSEMSE